MLDERFEADHAKLLAAWQALPKDREAPWRPP
jgi:hypothetical protein